MKKLPVEVWLQFLEIDSTIKKTKWSFSEIGIDQAHKQNRNIVKTDGGAIWIVDDEDALLELATSGQYLGNSWQYLFQKW